MELYFAYGSNMLSRQMIDRCPSARCLGVGYLRGFRLVFNRKGSYRSGAVASVELGNPETDRVFGVLWIISTEDLGKMDAIEDPSAYVRIAVPVSREGEEREYAWTYVSYPDNRGLHVDPDYLEVMIEGASESDLPEEYLASLVEWRDV